MSALAWFAPWVALAVGAVGFLIWAAFLIDEFLARVGQQNRSHW